MLEIYNQALSEADYCLGYAQEVLDTDEGRVAAAVTALTLVLTLFKCWPRKARTLDQQLSEIDQVPHGV